MPTCTIQCPLAPSYPATPTLNHEQPDHRICLNRFKRQSLVVRTHASRHTCNKNFGARATTTIACVPPTRRKGSHSANSHSSVRILAAAAKHPATIFSQAHIEYAHPTARQHGRHITHSHLLRCDLRPQLSCRRQHLERRSQAPYKVQRPGHLRRRVCHRQKRSIHLRRRLLQVQLAQHQPLQEVIPISPARKLWVSR